MAIDKFKLPREDWYDEVRIDSDSGEIVGRIYKDALIENFNAIEEQLNELAGLKGYDTELPDLSNFEYNDSTLESNDRQIINLRSLLNILGLVGYPLECTFSDKICKNLTYFGNDNTIHTIKDKELTTLNDSTSKYVILDYTTNELKASDSLGAENTTFIGMYNKGQVYCLNHGTLANINAMAVLSNMTIEPIDIKPINLTRATPCENLLGRNGRAIGYRYRESKGNNVYTPIMCDIGREAK